MLVGHSLSGLMAPIVADGIPARIARIVNLDGMVPENSKSLKDLIKTMGDGYQEICI